MAAAGALSWLSTPTRSSPSSHWPIEEEQALEQEQQLTPESVAIAFAQNAMILFRHTYKRELTVGNLAEVFAAQHLGLELMSGANHPGYDACDRQKGRWYQIKYRAVGTQNVEVYNFDFDYLLLVNLDIDYQPSGIWQLTLAQVRQLYAQKPNTKLYQASQKTVKAIGERLL